MKFIQRYLPLMAYAYIIGELVRTWQGKPLEYLVLIVAAVGILAAFMEIFPALFTRR